MPNYESLINQCVFKPTYNLMDRAYQDYTNKRTAPCGYGYKNQCAVRMSVALGRCGFSLDAFPNPSRVHDGREKCDCNFPHVVGAHELAKYLKKIWGADKIYRGSELPNAITELTGKKGIIYFNDVFKRDNGSAGDHIDLWNGVTMYNQILKTSVGGSAGYRTKRMFKKANRIWFFNLY